MHYSYKRILAVILAAAICITGIYLFFFALKKGAESPTAAYMKYKLGKEAEILKTLQFSLVDPGSAPPQIRELTIRGYETMLHTKKYAPEYAGNRLNCTNCHFGGGDSLGGPQTGIPLVGVAAYYPAFDKRMARVIDLPARINNCFTRSMNGKTVPVDSEIMLSLVTYFQWISKDLPIYGTMPWLGMPPLKTSHSGSVENGHVLYEKYCASCHHSDGQGLDKTNEGVNTPPLWGDDSFNDAAGFNNISKLSSFIHWNMPYFEQTPFLSEEDSIDIAAYILSKPRPKDENRRQIKVDKKS